MIFVPSCCNDAQTTRVVQWEKAGVVYGTPRTEGYCATFSSSVSFPTAKLVSFCPWCGTRLDDPEKPVERVAVRGMFD